MARSNSCRRRPGSRSIAAFLAMAVAGTCLAEAQAGPPLWKQLMPRKRVEADPQADYALKETDGPWLVLAAAFTGDTGEQQARDLVLELRGRYNLPAYYYGMTFDLDGEDAGRGINQYGGRVKRRLQRGEEVVQHAVLVGEFPAIDDADAQELLDQVKTMQPKTLAVDATETAQTLAGVRDFYTRAKRQLGKHAPAGPMSHAFMTRNPLLPREYFVPSSIDPEVAKWNREVKHSLMECPGKYSIRVATFRGRTALDGAKGAPQLTAGTRQATDKDPLVQAASRANRLVLALREKGWEAYVMHDRHESYVTIGSFNDGQRTETGQIVLNDQTAQRIMATFSATTPNLASVEPVKPKNEQEAIKVMRLTQLSKQQFSSRFTSHGKPADGFNPKSFGDIPFDIIPQAIEVPHDSVSARIARN
ncbi:MAG: hypothetical protein KF688_04225 [Pirellulales bacterium]|nr:hypothetical protein [Pirellulales bacterium]